MHSLVRCVDTEQEMRDNCCGELELPSSQTQPNNARKVISGPDKFEDESICKNDSNGAILST